MVHKPLLVYSQKSTEEVEAPDVTVLFQEFGDVLQPKDRVLWSTEKLGRKNDRDANQILRFEHKDVDTLDKKQMLEMQRHCEQDSKK